MRRRGFLAAALAGSCAGRAWAQSSPDYPVHTIRFIVPFAAGGGTDSQSRILAEAMGKRLGQALVVENLGGAGGTIGVNTVARAEPDGYTLLSATPSLTVNPYLQKDAAYDLLRDFTPVVQTSTNPLVLVVPAASSIQTVQDVIDMARAKPGQVRYGSAGIGSFAHVSSALFAAMAKVRMTHIPYRGTGPALIDLIAGRLQVQFENSAAVLPQIRGGQLRAIAVGSATRSALFPDLPTIGQTVPGYESSSWFGLLVPSKTPGPVVERLNAVVNDGLKDPAVQKQLTGLGVEIVGGSSEQFRTYLLQRIADMKVAADAANLKPQ